MSPPSSPLVTVITPAYNVGPYIEEAVDSVLGQSWTDFEYIVVDDGSSDDTVELVEQRASVDERLRLVRADHAGGPTARNTGIQQARGSYIAFLDGDDRWNSQFLEKQLALMQSLTDDVAAVFCRARVISEAGRVYWRRWQRSGRYTFDDMLIQSCPPRAGSSLLIRREAFDQAGLFDVDLQSAQDLDMWLRIQRDSEMPYFYGSRDYLLDIRVRAGAISRNHGKRFAALEAMTEIYAADLQHNPRGMAYIRAAVFAYRAEEDEYAQKFGAIARQAGLWRLLSDGYGRRLLGWQATSEVQRRRLRAINQAARAAFGRAVGVAGGIRR